MASALSQCCTSRLAAQRRGWRPALRLSPKQLLTRPPAPRANDGNRADAAVASADDAEAVALPPAADGRAAELPAAQQPPVQRLQSPAAAAAATPPQGAAVEQPAGGADATRAPAPAWRRLLRRSWHAVATNLWPLLVVHALCDAAVFCLHRLSHRATNELAVRLLGGGLLTPAALGNMWWLSADPAIANFQTGYQPLTFAVFLAAFPLNVLLKTLAAAATVLICQEDAGKDIAAPWWNLWSGLRAAAAPLARLRPRLAALWRPLFLVELAVAAAVVPLQARGWVGVEWSGGFASLAVVTLPLTLPLILDLQAAAPAAALEGRRGLGAIARSRALVRPIRRGGGRGSVASACVGMLLACAWHVATRRALSRGPVGRVRRACVRGALGVRWQLAVPFVGFVLAGRLAVAAKGHLLTLLPPRFYRELVELPLLVLLGGTALSVLFARLQDVLPWVAYTEAVEVEAAAAAAAPADDGGVGAGAANGAAGGGSDEGVESKRRQQAAAVPCSGDGNGSGGGGGS
eukprot:scaffold23.g4126.t1